MANSSIDHWSFRPLFIRFFTHIVTKTTESYHPRIMNQPGFRVGLGHDTHRLGPDRPLIIGGVEIPFDQGLIGHSDADVLLHAVTDSLLGAVGLGDIGEWFPDADPKWKDADSVVFLKSALDAVLERGWQPVNFDCTVFAQQPKLSPYKEQIKNRLADLLGVDASAINVKAKTGEKVGPIGRQEAISADAIVLLARTDAETDNS